MANPRIFELRTAEREQAARRRQRVQKTAAIIAACTVGVVGIGFGGLLVHAHFADQRQAPAVKIVKVKTVPIVAEANAAEAVAAAKAKPTQAVAEAAAAAPAAARLGGEEPATSVAVDADLAEKAAQEDVDHLAATDPRWARGAAGAAVIGETRGAAGALTALAPTESNDHADPVGPIDPAAGAIEDEKPEGVETAAIAPDEVKPKPVAKEKAAKADVTSNAPPKRMAAVTADVRLRAARNDRSAVLGVVPKGTEIGVVSCDGWCEVVFAGKRGFVYKNFVSGSKLTIVRKKEEEAADPAPSDTQPTIGRSPANRNPAEVGP